MATKSIFKYPLSMLNPVGVVELPSGAELLSVQVQGNRIMLWALVDDPPKNEILRKFRIIGTGWAIEQSDIEGFVYFTSVQAIGYVWHIWFEEI